MAGPLTGTPRILSSFTTASTDDVLAVLAPRDRWTAGDLTAAIFRARGVATTVVIDPYAWRVFATDDNTARMAFFAAIDAGTSELVVQPSSYGLIANYFVVSNSSFGDVSDFFHALNRRSVAQVINKYCRSDNQCFVIIDQPTMQVSFRFPSNGLAVSVALESVGGADFTACYHLTGVDYARLIFE